MPILKNKECEWACVQTPNTTYEPTYSINILLTKEEAKEVITQAKKQFPEADKCFTIKKNEDGNYVFKPARSVEKANGEGENKKPVVLDKGAKPTDVLVGNGSVVNVNYGLYLWKNKYGNGIGVDLKGVQIMRLVEYAEADADGFVNEEEDNDLKDETKKESKNKTTEDFDDDDFD